MNNRKHTDRPKRIQRTEHIVKFQPRSSSCGRRTACATHRAIGSHKTARAQRETVHKRQLEERVRQHVLFITLGRHKTCNRRTRHSKENLRPSPAQRAILGSARVAVRHCTPRYRQHASVSARIPPRESSIQTYRNSQWVYFRTLS